MTVQRQKPVGDRVAQTTAQMLVIAQHPAFRLGFLDAHEGLPLAHDRILERIWAETPENALKQMRFPRPRGADLFGDDTAREITELAQYRYEEGRLVSVHVKRSARGYSDPRFPPQPVLLFIEQEAARRSVGA